LAAVLPEVGDGDSQAGIELDGVKYRCRWRQSGGDGTGSGRILVLEEETR
jgi:hypothetical protein